MSFELHINHAHINTGKQAVSLFRAALLFIASAFQNKLSFSYSKISSTAFVTVEAYLLNVEECRVN
jgi:hypothetical protein